MRTTKLGPLSLFIVKHWNATQHTLFKAFACRDSSNIIALSGLLISEDVKVQFLSCAVLFFTWIASILWDSDMQCVTVLHRCNVEEAPLWLHPPVILLPLHTAGHDGTTQGKASLQCFLLCNTSRETINRISVIYMHRIGSAGLQICWQRLDIQIFKELQRSIILLYLRIYLKRAIILDIY